MENFGQVVCVGCGLWLLIAAFCLSPFLIKGWRTRHDPLVLDEEDIAQL